MRTLIDVPDDQMTVLTAIARRENTSRAALVRRAIADLLARYRTERFDDAFGLWKDGEDGLAYQERLRREW